MLLLGGASEESTLCEDITMSNKELVAQTYFILLCYFVVFVSCGGPLCIQAGESATQTFVRFEHQLQLVLPPHRTGYLISQSSTDGVDVMPAILECEDVLRTCVKCVHVRAFRAKGSSMRHMLKCKGGTAKVVNAAVTPTEGSEYVPEEVCTGSITLGRAILPHGTERDAQTCHMPSVHANEVSVGCLACHRRVALIGEKSIMQCQPYLALPNLNEKH